MRTTGAGKPVFYVLIGEQDNPHREKLQSQCNSKAIALLFKTLNESGPPSEDRIDNVLVNVIS